MRRRPIKIPRVVPISDLWSGPAGDQQGRELVRRASDSRRWIAPQRLLGVGAGFLLFFALVTFAVAAVWRHGRPGQVLWVDVGVYALVYAAAVVLVLSRTYPTQDLRRGWRWLAAALTAYAVGNVVFSLVVQRSPQPSYPSLADAFYLAWYPLTYVGLLALMRGSVGRMHAGQALDGLIAGLGATAVAVAVVVSGVLTLDGASTREIVVNLAYPIGDLLLLMLLVAGGSIVGARTSRSGLLLAGGLAVTAWADLVYLLQDSAGTYVEGGWVDLLWLLGVAGIAGAACSTQGRPAHASARGDTWINMVPPAAFALVSVLLIGAQQAGMISWQAIVPADAAILLGILRAVLRLQELRRVRAHEMAELRRIARTDELTGLPNRRGLSEQCGLLLRTSIQPRDCALVLGLDQLENVNHSLGHDRGDRLVRQLADRLTTLAASGTGWGRLSGSEFAILAPGSIDDGHRLAERILAALEAPFLIEDLHLHVTGRIGLADFARSSGLVRDPDEVLRSAALALHRARRDHVPIVRYDQDHDLGRERLQLTEQLRGALTGRDPDRNGIVVAYLQPQIHLRRQPLPAAAPAAAFPPAGVEALARWNHPTRGLLSPDAFLPLAAEAGLLPLLADIVLDAALAACRRWWQHETQIPVSVNLSASDLLDSTLVDRIARALDRHRLPARALVLELTEDTLMVDPVGARKTLTALRGLGAGISIDDYGTGYSSLAYLQDLPADELKLDRAFTSKLTQPPPTSTRAEAIIRSTADLAHSLGLRLVAEGIEDEYTANLLAALGADIGQGFFIATPLPPEELHTWLWRTGAGFAPPTRPPAQIARR
jgi:diguanylate cyclase (GGDEF)-like protein